jgi:hypothetical protein
MGLFSSIGKVVGGVVNGVTGLLGVKGQKDANSSANALAREQLEYQKELHKNQIQWKVEDAKKAGLHPLAALGVSPSSFSPVSGASSGVNYSGFNGVGDMLSDLGQDIDRSILQAKTKEEQKDALRLQNQSIALDLRGKDLNNQILEAELASRRARLAQMMGPPTPASSGLSAARYAIPGQSESRFIDKPINEHGFLRDSKGRLVDVVPSDDWKQRTEDTLVVEWLPWLSAASKNFMAKNFGQEVDGYYWHPERGEYLRSKPAPKRRPVWDGIKKFNQFLYNLNSLKYYPFRRHY